MSENEKWLNDFWEKFNIKQIKFKNRVQFKIVEFKIKQVDKYKALELIHNVIQNAKDKYFNKLISDKVNIG